MQLELDDSIDPERSTVCSDDGSAEIAGLDALELPAQRRPSVAARVVRTLWPKLLALFAALVVWQLVVLSGWKPDYVLPGPRPVLARLFEDLSNGTVWNASGITLRRAFVGYGFSVVVGGCIGTLVSQSRVIRLAVGSLITGLQTMPSIAWFPLAILLFKLSDAAIMFVVVLGAAPAIANGVIAGVESVPPLFDRVGTVLGATSLQKLRFVVLPASLPSTITGLKQGWAFAWRSLMAGELLVIVAGKPSIGVLLQNARDLSDTTWLLSNMIVVLTIGIGVDSIFSACERSVLRRRGFSAER